MKEVPFALSNPRSKNAGNDGSFDNGGFANGDGFDNGGFENGDGAENGHANDNDKCFGCGETGYDTSRTDSLPSRILTLLVTAVLSVPTPRR